MQQINPDKVLETTYREISRVITKSQGHVGTLMSSTGDYEGGTALIKELDELKDDIQELIWEN